jgi:hypothetical protein
MEILGWLATLAAASLDRGDAVHLTASALLLAVAAARDLLERAR